MFRLQMETLESVLPGKKIVITDDRKGSRRTWIFTGVEGTDLLKMLSGALGAKPGFPDEEKDR